MRDDSSCAVDFGSQSTVAMDLAEAEPVEPADVEVVDDSAAAGAAVPPIFSWYFRVVLILPSRRPGSCRDNART